MKETIVVRNRDEETWFIRLFTCGLFVVSVVLAVYSGEFLITMGLCLLFLIPAVVGLLYNETWKISFSRDSIQKEVFFRCAGTYSYAQIKDAVCSYSYTERFYVRLYFQNGKTLQFRMEDKNAEKAVKRITSHCSIRTKY